MSDIYGYDDVNVANYILKWLNVLTKISPSCPIKDKKIKKMDNKIFNEKCFS